MEATTTGTIAEIARHFKAGWTIGKGYDTYKGGKVYKLIPTKYYTVDHEMLYKIFYEEPTHLKKLLAEYG